MYYIFIDQSKTYFYSLINHVGVEFLTIDVALFANGSRSICFQSTFFLINYHNSKGLISSITKKPVQLTLLLEVDCVTTFILFDRLTTFSTHVQQNVGNNLFCLPSTIVPPFFYSCPQNCLMNEKYDFANALTSGKSVSWTGCKLINLLNNFMIIFLMSIWVYFQ